MYPHRVMFLLRWPLIQIRLLLAFWEAPSLFEFPEFTRSTSLRNRSAIDAERQQLCSWRSSIQKSLSIRLLKKPSFHPAKHDSLICMQGRHRCAVKIG